MELILSNTPPVRLKETKTTSSCFRDMISKADGLKIACGYVSAGSLADLKQVIEVNKKNFLELVIGMHHFEGITRSQYDEAQYLNDYLRQSYIGGVKISTALKYHGKVYSFLRNKIPFASIVGSSNLNSAFGFSKSYEVDLLIEDKLKVLEIDNFINVLAEKSCIPFAEWEHPPFLNPENSSLLNYDGVEKVSDCERLQVFTNKTNLSFKIPVKSDNTPRSNLNTCFGKGRDNNRGYVKTRSWYEVELIVPNQITKNPGYPKKGTDFKVYTDDGWSFRCKVSGDFSKNFRSSADLKILGRWIKGRLENQGILKIGQLVNSDMLQRYGRDNFELTATKDHGVWLLDFGVR